MSKKYELLRQNPYNDLYQIRALREFGNVRAGEAGGWIHSERDLSHNGNCWIHRFAHVCGDAVISDNALICDDVRIYDSVQISENACIRDEAKIFDYARIAGNAVIEDRVVIHDRARIDGNAKISKRSSVEGDVWIGGDAVVAEQQTIRFGTLITDITKGQNIEDSLRCQVGLSFNENDEVFCYKRVAPKLTSFYDPTFQYKVGEWAVAENPDMSYEFCTSGLHFSYKGYWKTKKDTVELLCRVRKEDIITIQVGKIRAKRAFVIGVD